MKLVALRLLTSLVLAHAGSAFADAPTVSSLQVEGSGCPNANSVAASLTDDGNGRFSYGLVLADLDAATIVPATTYAEEYCEVSVRVRPPAGHQMRIAAVMLQGRHDAPRQGTTTSVQSSYRLVSNDDDDAMQMSFDVQTNQPLHDRDLGDMMRITQAEGIGSELGNWSLKVETNDMGWSACGEQVTLEGSVGASASSDDGVTDAEIAVQRADVTTARGLAWGWEFRRCGGGQAGFDGRWESQYSVGNGWVGARLDISGGQGTYRTSGFTGQIFNVVVQGRDVTGRWSAQGSNGWIRFRLANDGRSFQGSYGLGQDSTVRGSWNGER